MDTAIVFLIIGLATVYIGRRFYKMFRQGPQAGCGCGCSGCAVGNDAEEKEETMAGGTLPAHADYCQGQYRLGVDVQSSDNPRQQEGMADAGCCRGDS